MMRRPHAIMVALPYQGHITPYVNLAMKLASNGFVVTFVHLEFIHHVLSSSQSEPDPFSEARSSGLDIRYTTLSDGFPVDHHRDDEYWEFMLLNFWSRVDEFVEQLIRSDPDLDPFLVADTLWTWQTAVAEKHNLLKVSFWTQPALVFSLGYHVEILRERGHFPCKGIAFLILSDLSSSSGVKSVSTKDLMPYLKEPSVGTLVHKVQMKAFEEVKKADFILYICAGSSFRLHFLSLVSGMCIRQIIQRLNKQTGRNRIVSFGESRRTRQALAYYNLNYHSPILYWEKLRDTLHEISFFSFSFSPLEYGDSHSSSSGFHFRK